MKKKPIAIVLLIALVVSIGIFSLLKKSNTSKVSKDSKLSEFMIRSAFADIDSDMILENKDDQDDDKKHDYIIIAFTSSMVDTKKEEASNPLNTKNYKFDNNPLPKDAAIVLGNNNQVIIKLPDGYLKGVNSPHTLSISKDLKDKDGQTLKGDFNIKLPFAFTSSNSSAKKSDGNNSTKNNDSTSNNNSQQNNGNQSSKSDNKPISNADIPKYTVKVINSVPLTTVIAVILDTPTPENYKVSVEDTILEIKKNNKGEKVFINNVDKELSFDEVNKLIKIEKIK